MAWVAIGAAAIGVVGGAVNANANRKAASGALGANSNSAPLDINQLITDARTNAAENYKNSIALEQQYNPAQAALRGQTNLALQNLANDNTAGARARNNLLGDVTGEPNSLLSQSADSILKQLALGGNLSAETQNAVVRGALQTGGQAGLGGSFAGRGLVARDLGLTSMGLLQQRQAAAQAAGQIMSTDALNRLGAAQNAQNSDAQRAGLLAAAIQGMPLPESGLSAGSIADVTIGQRNTQNQNAATLAGINAKSNTDQINALLGFGSTALTAYGKYNASPTTSGTGLGTAYGDMVAAMNK